jgi:hypothetical protein
MKTCASRSRSVSIRIASEVGIAQDLEATLTDPGRQDARSITAEREPLLALEAHLPVPQDRQIEEVVEQAGEPLGLDLEDMRKASRLFGTEPSSPRSEEKDRIEVMGRAQLVADAAQERVLLRGQSVSFLVGLAQARAVRSCPRTWPPGGRRPRGCAEPRRRLP